MKLVKEHINERFVEDSDPIEDMGIGISKIIENAREKICQKDEQALNTQYQKSITKQWRDNDDHSLLRGSIDTNTELKGSFLSIYFYTNKFKYKRSKKLINKVKYAKELLDYANILSMTEDSVNIYSTSPNQRLTQYNCSEVRFEIKQEYLKHFDKF